MAQTRLRMLLHRVLGMFRKRQLDHELDEEIQSHLEMQVEDNLRKGMSLEEAKYAARRSFGGEDQIKVVYRDHRGIPIVETMFQDLRGAGRGGRRGPGGAAGGGRARAGGGG